MLWQAQTGMYFRMAGGWTGPMPEEFARWPIANALMNTTYVPDARTQLMAFLVNHDVSTVIVSDDDPDGPTWRSLLAASGIAPVRTTGVSLYRVPDSVAARYKGVTALEAAVEANRAMFGALVAAAQKYLADRRDPENLNPGEVTKLGLSPSTWLVGPPPQWMGGSPAVEDDSKGHFRNGALLSASRNGSVIVGLAGYYDSLKPVIETYRNDALHVYFPYPPIEPSHAKDDDWGVLAVVFNRAGLDRAVEKGAQNPTADRASIGTNRDARHG